MQLSEVFLGLGEESFGRLLRTISIGKMKTYQLYERMKVRFRLNKLNSESVRKAAPRFWTRLKEGDEEFASELSQAILISHLDMIKAVLDFLGIPNQEGFFDKDIDAAKYLADGWQQRVFEEFRGKYPEDVLLFYINHLGSEVAKSECIFAPAAG
jgi:hypothetical protein